MKHEPEPLLLHRGHTAHKRFAPFTSSFRYKVAMIDVDIDRLDEAGRQSWLFGVERPALFSFRRKDHGELAKQALRPWAERQFAEAGLDIDGPIRLITFPRHAFYKFAPISVWIGFDETGKAAGILYEVRNTFGERHTYAAAIDGDWSRHSAPKDFHVSPFFDVSGKYEFSLQYTPGTLRLGVTTLKDGKPVHSASLATSARPATASNLAATALAMPFSTIGVTLGIHWEALKLWLKGARYHSRPAKAQTGPTVAVRSDHYVEVP